MSTNAPIYPSRILMVAKGNTYGTLENPVAANAIRTFNTADPQLQFEIVEREQEDGQPGRINPPAKTKTGISFTTSTYLAGSGTAGTAPGTDLLWLSCGLNKTVVTGASVTYAPVSLAGTSVLGWLDARLNCNGTDYVGLGCRGSFTATLTSNQLGFCEWNLMGIYSEPTNVAIPTPAPASQALALPMDSTNTTTFTLGGVSVAVNSFTFQQNNTMELVDAMGTSLKNVRITNRTPDATITIYEPQLAAFNYFQKCTSNATDALQVVHGPAGNRVTINIPKFSYGPSTRTDINGISGITIPLYIGHDEGLPNDYSVVFS